MKQVHRLPGGAGDERDVSAERRRRMAGKNETAANGDWEIDENGLWVATRAFLLRRGYCCGNGCRNCPYAGTPLDRYPGRRAGAKDPPTAC